ncbi:MAG: hypothetical protein HC824_13975 [Synechococcales cyanobacterium RM1_1_8]|nr:hypothetical protein [Synechococcales cyanobacterium RM1_1_8]
MSFVAPLALAVTLLSLSCFFVVGLISVPWPVLLLVLLAGLFLTQRIILRMGQDELELMFPTRQEHLFRD